MRATGQTRRLRRAFSRRDGPFAAGEGLAQGDGVVGGDCLVDRASPGAHLGLLGREELGLARRVGFLLVILVEAQQRQ